MDRLGAVGIPVRRIESTRFARFASRFERPPPLPHCLRMTTIREIIGQDDDGEPVDELDNFCICPSCGQPIDMRDLSAVFHHEDPGHEPLPVEDAMRLLLIGERLRAVLKGG